jgi:hypothetical protein
VLIDQPGSHFIFIFSKSYVYGKQHYISYKKRPLTNKEYLTHWGKWVIINTREYLETLAQKLDLYVEKGLIPCIKYDRKPIEEFENLLLNDCVMCVYCDDRQKEEVWNILVSEGVDNKAWVYEHETMQKWLPGGLLLENWIQAKKMKDEDAEKVRNNAKEYFDKLFADENSIFKGVVQ